MALATGTKLGAYEVLSTVGAGGMGEVYRARDPRLNREVAIKVILASSCFDTQRTHRFEQEARAAAALNHPNILAVYDLGTQDGAPYIVSELLEGETLREHLRAGPLPLRTAIDYASQVAQGLAAAHDKGIVHRDLKPENIFITNGGRVKLLDFGLAKLTHPDIGHDGQTITTMVDSDPGTMLGTVGYMSPEQVRAKPVDARSDLFSFGAILYEMLLGKRAFQGESAAETMSAILKEDPPDLTETNRSVPPALERIVRHCLEKNPAGRFQSAHDLGFNLEALTGTSKLSSSIQPPIAKRRTWLIPTLFSFLAIAALGLTFLWGRSLHSTSRPEFHQLTFRSGTVYRARFANDGATILYSAAWEGKPTELFTTRYGSVESRPLEAETFVVAVSSKNQIAVLLKPSIRSFGSICRTQGTLALLPMEGGAPRPLLDRVEWADWTPDGSELAIIRATEGGSRMFDSNVLEFPVDKMLYASTRGWLSDVRFSPDGKYLALEQHVPFGDDGQLIVLDRAGKKIAESPRYATIKGLAWASNEEVWFTASPGEDSRAVQAMNLKGKMREVYRAPGDVTIHDVASNGRVLLSNDNDRELLLGGVAGSPDKDLSWLNWSLASDISSDGSTAVFSESSAAVGGKVKTFLRKLDGSPAVMLGEGLPSTSSPDGNWVATLDNQDPPNLVLLPTGVGRPQQLNSNRWYYSPAVAWMPDSKALIVNATQPDHKPRAYLLNLSTREVSPVLPEGVVGGLVSSDGRFLVGRDSDDTYKVYTMSGAEVRTLPKLNKDEYLDKWASDGKSLLVWNVTSTPKLLRMDSVTGKRVPVMDIKPPDLTGIVNFTRGRSTPDGKAHVYSAHHLLTDLFVVNGLR